MKASWLVIVRVFASLIRGVRWVFTKLWRPFAITGDALKSTRSRWRSSWARVTAPFRDKAIPVMIGGAVTRILGWALLLCAASAVLAAGLGMISFAITRGIVWGMHP